METHLFPPSTGWIAKPDGRMQDQNVANEDWDYLLILDACRYDIFERVYRDYLDGDLEKRVSRGSSTPDWLAKTFSGQTEFTYFSANPYVNSKGLPLNKSFWGSSCKYTWKPTDHFSEIVDVWDFGWDDRLGTVPPRNVNDAFLSRPDDTRTIIHYIQPHSPYLAAGRGIRLKQIRSGIEGKGINPDGNGIMPSLGRWMVPRLERLIRRKRSIMKLGMWLDMGPKAILSALFSGGKDILQSYYEDNMRSVLKCASRLIEEIEGKVVVTTDHGEAFGEQGVWEHPIETHIPVLVQVPWLEIER